MTHEYKGIENELYLRAHLQHMVKNPSDSRAQSLQNIFDDISIDFSSSDFGEEPNKSNYQPFTSEGCDEEEF